MDAKSRRRLFTAMLVSVATASINAQTMQVGELVALGRESDPRRFSEPHLAVHPANPRHLLAAVWTALTTEEPSQQRRCASFVSLNGGTSWTRHDFPLANCYDAQVAILPDGQAVFSALATLDGLRPDRPDWLVVYHSGDGGVTWDGPPTTLGYRFDHPALAVDLGSSRRRGWLYLTAHLEWSDGTDARKSAIFVARSRDGGKTFDVPAMVAPSRMHNFAEMPVVLADGTLAVAFVEDAWTPPRAERRRAWMVRSTDGGVTFSPPSFVNQECGPPPAFQLSALAGDTSDGPFRDRLYFACRQSGGGPVVIARSPDRGETWNQPGVVVGPKDVDRDARRVMTLAVNRDGILGAMIVERRDDAGAKCLTVNFAASLDGGESFLPAQTVSSSACGTSQRDGMAKRRFPTYGDYFGFVATADGAFRLMWSEMRANVSTLLIATVTVDTRRR